jgi:hypothetical protein
LGCKTATNKKHRGTKRNNSKNQGIPKVDKGCTAVLQDNVSPAAETPKPFLKERNGLAVSGTTDE